ncbi:MAG: FmdB family zinc ribbon protein [Myxococcota bacterium]
MPDYEFYCRKCKKTFSAHMSVAEHDQHAAPCPNCKQDEQVEKRISFVHVQTSKKS